VSGGNVYKTAQEFVDKMDRGLLEGNFTQEIKKLSPEQLEEVAEILKKRSPPPEKSRATHN
jgi:hypothetical protein